MDRIYPFQSKSGAKKNALQRTGFTYALKSDVRFTTNDENFFKPKMFEDAKSGVQQNASLNTNLKFLNTIKPPSTLIPARFPQLKLQTGSLQTSSFELPVASMLLSEKIPQR